MKEVHVKLISEIVSNDTQEITTIEGVGVMGQLNQSQVIRYNDGNQQIQLVFNESSISIKRNGHLMHLKLNKLCDYVYNIGYGEIMMQTFLFDLKIEKGLKFKYRLFNNDQLISQIKMEVKVREV